MTRTDLSILDSNGCLKVPTKVVIKNASELNQEDITNHKSISNEEQDLINQGYAKVFDTIKSEFKYERNDSSANT